MNSQEAGRCLDISYRGRLHVEVKRAALADSLRIDIDSATAFFDDLLHNCQAEPDAFVIQVGRPVQLAKLGE